MSLSDHLERLKSLMGLTHEEGINFIFSSTPEIVKIGTKEQYARYIKTIFPNSKHKGIVYHGSVIGKLQSIDKRFTITWWSTSLDYVKSKPLWRDNIVAAVVNIKNPLYADKPLAAVPPEDEDFLSPAYTSEKYDSVIGLDAGQELIGGKTIAMKNNKAETHILGTKEDLLSFKRFVNVTE